MCLSPALWCSMFAKIIVSLWNPCVCIHHFQSVNVFLRFIWAYKCTHMILWYMHSNVHVPVFGQCWILYGGCVKGSRRETKKERKRERERERGSVPDSIVIVHTPLWVWDCPWPGNCLQHHHSCPESSLHLFWRCGHGTTSHGRGLSWLVLVLSHVQVWKVLE